MYLHRLLYQLSFVAFYLPLSTSIRNKHLVTTRSGIKDVSPCSIGLKFFSELNNTSDEDFFVELISDECCIRSGDSGLDCDSVEIIGESSQVIEKGQAKTFTLVAPILDPFERKGFCTVHVDSRPIDKRNIVMRDTIKINFDTTLKNNEPDIDSKESIKKCKHIDEDPLNDCKPVDCDTYYNGKKPIYDENAKRCVEVPKCKNVESDIDKLYDPVSNRCIDSGPIDSEDIDYIKSINKERHAKDIIIVESSDFPILYNSESDLKSDLINTTKAKKIEFRNNQFFCESFLKYLTTNKYTFLILVMVIFVQCCFICTMIYFVTKRSIFCDKKKVERKYFNYRQDASVTTPLIGTSNMDTETTDFEYVTESSKIDNKIKCYKACQKERKNDPKISMSDDILLKCLHRRDWSSKPKSDTNRDIDNAYNNTTNPDWNTIKSNIQRTIQEQYVNNEIAEVIDEMKKESEEQDFRTRAYKEDYGDSDSSEKLIQSHDYNTVQSRNNIDNETATNKKAATVSTEKGAQASFSNDSIDDFLSERGMVFLAGDPLSKYSFTSTPSTSADRSSKTSKKNVLKNVLSYFSRRSKKHTSDPGVKEPERNLELIHMSRGSMYSSSASEYRNVQGVRFEKESRTSF